MRVHFMDGMSTLYIIATHLSINVSLIPYRGKTWVGDLQLTGAQH